MDIRLITSYSGWLVLPCLILAASIAWFFYFRDNKNSDFPPKLVIILIATRFVVLFFMFLLLLSPVVEYLKKFTQRPLILVLHDNSQSMVLTRDSSMYKSGQYIRRFKELTCGLPNNFEVVHLGFDQKLNFNDSLKFTGFGSNLENALRDVVTRFDLSRISSVVISSDGIVNEGQNPVYMLSDFNFPIHVVCLGDTIIYPDVAVENIDFNRLAYLNSSQTFFVHLSTARCKNKNLVFRVLQNGQEILKKSVVSLSDKDFMSIPVNVVFQEEGIHKFTFEINANAKEQNIANNKQTIAVEVINNQQKILILANSPHPDAGAIYETLKRNPTYKTRLAYAGKFSGSLKEFDLVIFVHLPSLNFPSGNWFKEVSQYSIPNLVLIGGNTNIYAFNALQVGLKINGFKNSFDDAYPVVNATFNQFSVPDELVTTITAFPPLLVPFGEYELSGADEVLVYQRIRTSVTRRPLVVFNTSIIPFFGVICGEGLWRWRMDELSKNMNQSQFDLFLIKTIQLVGTKEREERFYVHTKSITFENQIKLFDADVYNKSLDPVSNAEVEMEIENSQEKKLSYRFTQQNKTYSLNVGILSPGDYSYKASCKLGDEKFEKSGYFTILPLNKERINLTADHHIQKQIAEFSGGKVFYSENLDSLKNVLSEITNERSFSYIEKELSDFVHFKWLFFMILCLLSVEWFLRKYYGAI